VEAFLAARKDATKARSAQALLSIGQDTHVLDVVMERVSKLEKRVAEEPAWQEGPS
jgi:hypothetical protein